MITYLNFTGISERVGKSSAHLRGLRAAGRMPEPDAMVGDYPGWLPATIDAWLEEPPAPRGRPRKTEAES